MNRKRLANEILCLQHVKTSWKMWKCIVWIRITLFICRCITFFCFHAMNTNIITNYDYWQISEIAKSFVCRSKFIIDIDCIYGTRIFQFCIMSNDFFSNMWSMFMPVAISIAQHDFTNIRMKFERIFTTNLRIIYSKTMSTSKLWNDDLFFRFFTKMIFVLCKNCFKIIWQLSNITNDRQCSSLWSLIHIDLKFKSNCANISIKRFSIVSISVLEFFDWWLKNFCMTLKSDGFSANVTNGFILSNIKNADCFTCIFCYFWNVETSS